MMVRRGLAPVPDARIRVLSFADVVNRGDFIDNVVRHANPAAFSMMVCTMGRPSNIEDPSYDQTSIPHWAIAGRSRWQYPWTLVALAAILRRQRIDIIHAHHFDPTLIASIASLFSRRTRVVVGRHYSDAIYLHTSGLRQRAMLALERWVNLRSCHIVVPSAAIASLLRSEGVADDKVSVIPYGFEPSRFAVADDDVVSQYKKTLGLEGVISVGTFGRLYSDKGHRFALDALPMVLNAFPTLRYVIVGDGQDRERLEEHAAQLGVADNVTFLGWRRDVASLMAAVDIVLQPSLQEAFSQSMAEALLLGRPLVISDVSGAEELVPNDTIGVVVPARDANALGEALIALARDPNRRTRLALAGREHALANFGLAGAVRRYERAYEQCCSNERR